MAQFDLATGVRLDDTPDPQTERGPKEGLVVRFNEAGLRTTPYAVQPKAEPKQDSQPAQGTNTVQYKPQQGGKR
jgi:hypothetical protein